MKLSLFSLVLLGALLYGVRRLNGLVAAIRLQSAEIEELRAQTAVLRAELDSQQAAIEEVRLSLEASEAAILDGVAQRNARWREMLTDLDSPN